MNSIFIDTSNDIKLKSILIVSNDEDLISLVKKNEDKLSFKTSFFELNKFHLICDKLSLFDVVVFDNRITNQMKDFVQSFESKYTYRLNIPMIVLDDKVEEGFNMYKNSNVYTVVFEPIDFEKLTLNINLCINYLFQNKKVEFEKGFYFDVSRDQLFFDKKMVKLTKTEKALVKLLIERKNQLVTYETIEKVVWKNKNFSKYSLRNIVKHIREKTNETLIKNASNRGYIVNTI